GAVEGAAVTRGRLIASDIPPRVVAAEILEPEPAPIGTSVDREDAWRGEAGREAIEQPRLVCADLPIPEVRVLELRAALLRESAEQRVVRRLQHFEDDGPLTAAARGAAEPEDAGR